MGEFLAVLPIEGGVAVGILLAFAVMVARGHLVPGPMHREAIAERDKRIEYTESALDTSLKLNSEQAATIAKQTATSEVAAHMLEELRREQSRAT